MPAAPAFKIRWNSAKLILPSASTVPIISASCVRLGRRFSPIELSTEPSSSTVMNPSPFTSNTSNASFSSSSSPTITTQDDVDGDKSRDFHHWFPSLSPARLDRRWSRLRFTGGEDAAQMGDLRGRDHGHAGYLWSSSANILQERIMRVPYGKDREFFKYSLFLVFCNRITTSTAAAGAVLVNKKALDPVAPLYKYCAVSVSNILTTTCQYEALKYVSFPVQTLAKCAKMIPVMVWGTFIMQKRYNMQEYLLAVLVTVGCTLFILYPAGGDINPYSSGRESTVWGVTLMMGYLGFDGFTSTFQDKLFKGYNMEIYNQIFYTTLCSCILSLSGLIMQGHLLLAVDFVYRHRDCLLDVILLSTVATLSQFFISYTIRTFGALTFATIMTTRQLVSILLSCVWFGHPLSWEQMAGASIVFGSLYSKSFLKSRPQKALQSTQALDKSNYMVIEDVEQSNEDHRHKQASLGR
ncbi:UDP-galactose transporter-like protein 1 [Nymphaea thermarum]|nr:UDP-galactose transporter-like protein 1 [Nymphaea thermarum]